MNDDAPVLLGKLEVKLHSASTNQQVFLQQQAESFSYQPPLALFPQLVTISNQNTNHQQGKANASSSKQQKSSSVSLITDSFLNRERSSWDVTALSVFRDGTTERSTTSTTSKNNNNNNKFKSARDALSALAASGKLPGGSSSSSNSFSGIPSTVDIVKALDKFAAEIGAAGKDDETGAALRSSHFLHILGFQRLEQLRGNLQALNNNNNNNSNNKIEDHSAAQPFKMFSTAPTEESGKDWISQRTKLYESILNLAGEQQQQQQNENNGTKSGSSLNFWSAPVSTKASIEIQTDRFVEEESAAVINWNHPQNNINSTNAIKANEKISCKFPQFKEEKTGWNVVISVKKVNQNTSSNFEVDENDKITIPLTSKRVCFGRTLSSGTIRQRMNDNEENEQQQEENLEISVDPFHVDLSSAVRKLTNRLDHGLYVSRQHFVLSVHEEEKEQDTTITLLPCSLNFIRVNGALCYAAPSKGLKHGDEITIGSGNTSPAGVVILIKLEKN
jgi:hypothetical protein